MDGLMDVQMYVLIDGPTDGPTDRRTDKASYSVACPQLKTGAKRHRKDICLWKPMPKNDQPRQKNIYVMTENCLKARWTPRNTHQEARNEA